MTTDPTCLFCKIVAGQIPSAKIYEDDELIVFRDIHPAAPVHLLVVPKLHVASLELTGPEHQPLLGRMLGLAPRLAHEQGASNGFRVVFNNGPDGGQEIYHLHMHILGGPRPWGRMA